MELIYTWSELKAVQDRIAEIEKESESITDMIIREKRSLTEPERLHRNALWEEYSELDKKREEMRKQTIPEVGMPCTVIYYSDRSSAVVTEVRGKAKKEVVVKQCGIYSSTKVFTYRRNGHWVSKGSTSRDWGTLLGIGYQSDYYDPSY